jgi:SIR2-like protein
MARTVWILGAGFSKPLGGPLLDELLTAGSQARVRATFPKEEYGKLHDDFADFIRALYRLHGPHAEIGDRHWDDAEAFLEALDLAALGPTNSPSARLIELLVRRVAGRAGLVHAQQFVDRTSRDLMPLLGEVSAAAKRLVAAECCAFLRGVDPKKAEKWAPYRRWARSLAQGDTVITFNYDRAAETARDAAVRSLIVERGVPGNPMDTSGDVPLYKLHGSVDWQQTGSQLHHSTSNEFAITCGDGEIAIGSPGPNKSRLSESLSEIWNEALERIRYAEVVVFVGYRFPPSDSEARSKLVAALSANQSPVLVIRTVLGSDTTNKDTLRLKGILQYAMHSALRVAHDEVFPFKPGQRALVRESGSSTLTYFLRIHPLGAEDFLDLFEQGHLNLACF